MSEELKKIIEVNGIKMELDYRSARLSQIDTFKIGDRVKILIPEHSNSFKSCLGIIVGFDNFKTKPTIIVAYLTSDYSPTLNFAYITAGTECKYEIVPADEEIIKFAKEDLLERMDREITDLEKKINELKDKKNYFISNFEKRIELTQQENK